MKQDNGSMDEVVAKGNELEERGLFQEAMALWQSAIDNSEDPSLMLLKRLANAAEEAGDFERAEKAYVSAIERAPDDDLSYCLLGLLYDKQSQDELARDQFEKALRIKETPDAFVFLGCSELRLGLFQEARRSLEKAIERDPTHEEAYYNLGVTYIHYRGHKEPQVASELFRKALELDPEYALAHRELGRTLVKLRQPDEAMKHLEKAMQLKPNDYRTYMYLGNLYTLRREPQLTEEAYRTAVKLAPESEAVLNLATFYKFQGFNDQARDLYEKALLVHPDKAWAEIEFSTFLRGIGEIESAKHHLKEALRIDPDYTAEAENLLRSME